MFSFVSGRKRTTPFWRRAAQDENGAAAIEFALVVTPFLAIVGLILETAFQAYSLASLDDALRRASRSLQTGAAQIEGRGVDQFRQQVCGLLQPWMSCDSLVVDVRPVATFRGISRNLVGPNGTNIGGLEPLAPTQGGNLYCPGLPGSLTLVRADFQIPTLFGFWIPTATANGYTLSSAHTFLTEPFVGSYNRPAQCSSFGTT